MLCESHLRRANLLRYLAFPLHDFLAHLLLSHPTLFHLIYIMLCESHLRRANLLRDLAFPSHDRNLMDKRGRAKKRGGGGGGKGRSPLILPTYLHVHAISTFRIQRTHG